MIRANDETKLKGIAQALLLAEAILETRDRAVSLEERVAIHPDFDGRPYGGETPFAGSDPAAIADPVLRQAYEKAIADNQVKLQRFVTELKKMAKAHYALDWITRIIAAGRDPAALWQATTDAVRALEADDWIKQTMLARLFPDTEAPPPTPPASPTTTPTPGDNTNEESTNVAPAPTVPPSPEIKPPPKPAAAVSEASPAPVAENKALRLWLPGIIALLALVGWWGWAAWKKRA